jgi:hypothetical protein
MHLYFYRYCARYQTRQIEEDKQALGLVINTVARGWSPTRLSTVLRLASHFLTQRCIFFCFRILTQSKALHNFLAWRWCSNDRPRKTNYYREIGICSFTLNLGKTNFYTSPLKKLPWRRVIAVYCVQYYDWSTFKVFMCEKNMFYWWGFS